MDSHRESSVSFTAEEYEKYRLLMHKVAKKHYGVLLYSGSPEEYEDVFQNVVMSFLRAKEGFDPAKGFKFTTYAVASANKNFSVYMSNRKQKIQPVSLETLKVKDEDVSFWQEVIPDENNMDYKPSMKMKIQEAIEKIKVLTPIARLVVRELVAPSDEIKKAYKEKLSFVKKARETGNPVPRLSDDIDYRFIFQYYKINVKKQKSIYEEIKRVFEI